MSNNKQKEHVHILTNKVEMRFTPIRYQPKQQTPPTQPQSLYQKIMSFLPIKKPDPPIQSSRMLSSKIIHSQSRMQQLNLQLIQETDKSKKEQKLTFALMLTSEHLMIGNSRQLDVIYIGKFNTNDYVETQYLWSIRKKQRISHVCLEQKKINMLVLVCTTQVYIYNYDSKKFPTEPFPTLKNFTLESQPKFVEIVRQSNICFFFETHLQIFVGYEDVRRRYKDQYDIPKSIQSKFSLFYVPQSYENYINIFFEQNFIEDSNVFVLWCIQLQFSATQVKAQPIQKIYQIKTSLKKSIKINNYSKQIFLLNLGSEILALKKGYILDSATVNKKRQISSLEYLGNDNLLHISSKKIEAYIFTMDLLTKPFKISIRPRDSIKVNSLFEDEQFFKAFPVLINQFIIIFQKKASANKMKKGQLRYSFYITRKLSKQEKMFQLFPRDVKKFSIEDPDFMEKCDMAEKMGYTKKQIYHELWNRSQKSSQQDYSLLLATCDYKTITQEMIRKLKKNSVNFTQIQSLEKSSFEMLKNEVFSTKCTFDAVTNYLNCHLFNRKLAMFREIKTMQKMKSEANSETDKEVPKMNIREYQFYRGMELKNQLLSYINDFCHQNNEHRNQLPNKIRFLLSNFKFAFRVVYEEILLQIIKNANVKLVVLLSQIPQILPYNRLATARPFYIPNDFEDGIWSQIGLDEWEHNIYYDTIITIDNKQVVQQVCKHINFKRNWLYQHDMVAQWKYQILQHESKVKSPHIFYYFVAQLFQHIEDRDKLKEIVKFLQTKYSPNFCRLSFHSQTIRSSNRSMSKHVQDVQSKIPYFPENIKGKVFLLEQIYIFFQSRNIVPIRKGSPCSLSQFLYFQDPQLIKHCFDKERSMKGLILKDIKGIYMQNIENHEQMFNKALLNYFISDLSEISDLKYLLNRINNENHQFHKENTAMYAVLVEALQRKMKIGTGNDIPLDQVLIYLENIPLHRNEESQDQDLTSIDVLDQLKAICGIKQQSQYLQRCKINMSIYDILRHPEQVFTKLIQFVIKQSNSRVWRSIENFIPFAIVKIVEVQQFALQVYHFSNQQEDFKKIIFFIFLSKLCQEVGRIKFAKGMLQNKQIGDRYDDFTAQSLVQFMYKWKMSKNNCFTDNESYILQLLTLIPETLNTYQFIYNELQFAKMLSDGFLHQVTYPISETFVNIDDIREIIDDLTIEFVMKIDINRLYEVVHNIQSIVVEEVDYEGQVMQKSQQITVDPKCKTTLSQLYQIIILKYLRSGKLKEVINYINILIDLPKDQGHSRYDYSIIFVILYLMEISIQLNEQNKENIIQCLWYYFYQPKQLMSILDYIVNTPLSPQQMKLQIIERLEEGKRKYKGYNRNNQILREQYLNYAGINEDHEKRFIEILKKIAKHIQGSKQDFKSIKYSVIIIILFNEPYSLSKFVQCSLQNNVKPIRSVLSYAILQDILDPLKVLEAGKRVFLILFEANMMKFPLEVVIKNYFSVDLDEDMWAVDEEEFNNRQLDQYETILWKSAEAFRNKKEYITKENIEDNKNKKIKVNINAEQLKNKIEKLFENIDGQLKSREPSHYIFEDSDNEDKGDCEIKESINRKKPKQVAMFVPKNERNAVFSSIRMSKPCALYKPMNLQSSIRKSANLFVSQSFNRPSHANQTMSSGLKKFSNISCGQSVDIAALPHLNINNSELCQSSHSLMQQEASVESEEINIDIKSPTKISSENVLISSPKLKEQQPKNTAQKIPRLKLQQLGQSEQEENSCSPNRSEEDLQQKSNETIKYIIILNEVRQPDDDDTTAKGQRSSRAQEYEVGISKQQIQQMVNKLIACNSDEEGNKFDLSPVQSWRSRTNYIKHLLLELYRRNLKQFVSRNVKIMQAIVQSFQPHGISVQQFKLVCKVWQAQSKTISQIPFNQLVSEKEFCRGFGSSREIFDDVYRKLKRHIGSQNIYTVSQFIRRAFENSQYEQQVTWDFVMDLCSKFDATESEQKEWTLQKIQATLPKIETRLWNIKFEVFKNKVMQLKNRDFLLNMFCEIIKNRADKKEGVVFLKRVLQIYQNSKVKQTLESIQKEA